MFYESRKCQRSSLDSWRDRILQTKTSKIRRVCFKLSFSFKCIFFLSVLTLSFLQSLIWHRMQFAQICHYINVLQDTRMILDHSGWWTTLSLSGVGIWQEDAQENILKVKVVSKDSSPFPHFMLWNFLCFYLIYFMFCNVVVWILFQFMLLTGAVIDG